MIVSIYIYPSYNKVLLTWPVITKLWPSKAIFKHWCCCSFNILQGHTLQKTSLRWPLQISPTITTDHASRDWTCPGFRCECHVYRKLDLTVRHEKETSKTFVWVMYCFDWVFMLLLSVREFIICLWMRGKLYCPHMTPRNHNNA